MAINHKKIFKNTTLMYVRTAVTMIISLITVRIVLKVLGIQDYGLYNVVSGIVVTLSFISNTLATTTQRYLSYELGLSKSVANKSKSIFGTSIILYLILSFFIIIIAETLGLWFLNSKMTIPNGRIFAANWIYQFSIVSFICTIISSPYNACIISHEKMDVYAYISILDAALKLLLIFLINMVSGDKLILYGLLLMIISIAQYIFYLIYCRRQFEECHYSFSFNKSAMMEFGKFAGWNMWGAVANVFMGQGVNLLLNAFFNVIINAARGLAYQVDRALNTLVQNFFTAVRPQIVKNYAIEEYDEMYCLVFQSTRLGYYLMYVISIFCMLNMEIILNIWLGDYPEETILFSKLVIIANIIIVFAQPFSMVIMASGKIANYQIIGGTINILVLPVSWLIIKLCPNYNIPFYVMIVSSVLYSTWTIFKSYLTKKFGVDKFLIMLSKIILTTIVISFVSIWLNSLFSANLLGLILSFMSIVLLSAVSIYFIDLNKLEKSQILNILYRIIKLK